MVAVIIIVVSTNQTTAFVNSRLGMTGVCLMVRDYNDRNTTEEAHWVRAAAFWLKSWQYFSQKDNGKPLEKVYVVCDEMLLREEEIVITDSIRR
ncbi:hypothetical protein LSH36_23g09018 [Paralvinella palmiformis]|uniref:Uncharacterized protein n=1 Tax=Paralvinella palmiformis TaxID=53620 RepID=A0AAD9KBZ2_9ANNE|nr:hypothetical protein LSH36_23g09018 [Paralvinella palmiformis]